MNLTFEHIFNVGRFRFQINKQVALAEFVLYLVCAQVYKYNLSDNRAEVHSAETHWYDNTLDIATIPTKIEAKINELPETQNRGKYCFTGDAFEARL